jgi:hypothetical protein
MSSKFSFVHNDDDDNDIVDHDANDGDNDADNDDDVYNDDGDDDDNEDDDEDDSDDDNPVAGSALHLQSFKAATTERIQGKLDTRLRR